MVTALALALSSSGLDALCIEDDHSSFELAWALCCSEDTCCADDSPDQPGQGVIEETDDCRDYLLSSTQDWTPDPSTDWDVALATLASPSAWTFIPAASWPEPIPPSGAPPPRRDLKTVVIRC